MNCEISRVKLSPYIEGELSELDKAAMEKHLSGCPHCAAELEAMRTVLVGLKTLPQPEAPDGFRHEVWKRIDAQQPKRLALFEPWFIKLPVGALATAAVALLVIQVHQSAGPVMMEPAKRSDVAGAPAQPKQKLAANLDGFDRSQSLADELQSASTRSRAAQMQPQRIYGKFAGATAQAPAAESELKERDADALREAAKADITRARRAQVARRGAAKPAPAAKAPSAKDLAKAEASLALEEARLRLEPQIEFIRLEVADAAAAQNEIALILKDLPIEEADWILPTRYAFTIPAEYYDVLLERLSLRGTLGIEQTKTASPDVPITRHRVILDLIEKEHDATLSE